MSNLSEQSVDLHGCTLDEVFLHIDCDDAYNMNLYWNKIRMGKSK